jgi:hypothetical protein
LRVFFDPHFRPLPSFSNERGQTALPMVSVLFEDFVCCGQFFRVVGIWFYCLRFKFVDFWGLKDEILGEDDCEKRVFRDKILQQ